MDPFSAIESAKKTIETGQTVYELAKPHLDKAGIVREAIEDTISQLAGIESEEYRKDLERRLKRFADTEEFKLLIRDSQRKSILPDETILSDHLIRLLENIADDRDSFTLEQLVKTFVSRLTFRLAVSDKIHDVAMQAQRFEQLSETVRLSGASIEKKIEQSLESRAAIICFEDDSELRDTKEMGYHAALDTCKTAIDEMQLTETYEKLKTLESEVGFEKTDYLRYRVASLLGICLLRMHRLNESRESLILASTLFKDSHVPWINLAYCCLAMNKFPEALCASEKAISLKPKNRYAATVRILSLSAKEMKGELETFLSENSWVNEYPQCLFALGQHAYDNNEFESSENFFRLVLGKKPKDVDATIQLAQAIARPIMLALQNEHHRTNIVSQVQKERLIEAKELVSEGFKIIETWDAPIAKWKALLFRSSLYRLLMDKEGAKKDCEDLFKIDSESSISKITKAIIAFDEYDFEEIYNNLKDLPKEDIKSAWFLAIPGYIRADKLDLADELMNEIETEKFSSDLYYISLMRLYIANAKDQFEIGVSQLLRDYGERADILTAIAFIQRESGEHQKALRLLLQVRDECGEPVKNFVYAEMARNYMDLLFWKQAVIAFEKYVDMDTDSPDLREYIRALANSEQIFAAYKLAQKLRKINGQVIPVVTDIEADYVLKVIKDIELARYLASSLINLKISSMHTWRILREANRNLGNLLDDCSIDSCI